MPKPGMTEYSPIPGVLKAEIFEYSPVPGVPKAEMTGSRRYWHSDDLFLITTTVVGPI